MLNSCLRGLLAQEPDGVEAIGLNDEEQCRKGGTCLGQALHLKRSWEQAGGLLRAITLVVERSVVETGDDVAWSAENFEQRRAGIGAIGKDSRKRG
jgi:hypothetical protein